MEEKQKYDTIIIGSGPAGLTAAIYNQRAALKTVVIAGNQPGGQLTITTVVDNFPGFPKGVGGVKLMMDMQEQVKNLGVEIRQGWVEKVIKTGEEFEVHMAGNEVLRAKAVIVATGAAAKWLNMENEKELIGKGVSGCATCDGMFFRDKIVAVVGGGDTAAEEADFLTRFASRVYLIHRRDQLRASVAGQRRILNNPKIEIIWNTEIQKIVGTEKLEKVVIKNNQTGEEKDLVVDGLFVAIGHNPATNFVRGVADMGESGHIIIGKNRDFPMMTSVEGLFAAGDCSDEVYRQAISSAGDGCKAALDAERWLNMKNN